MTFPKVNKDLQKFNKKIFELKARLIETLSE